jgi:CheY-like chemotaxis protein/transcriptional regulator with XRE-family HTH domain
LATILLIDEDVALLSSLSSALSEAGHSVLTTSDLSHARHLHASERIDLVLLEVRSERDNGWELLQEIAPETPTMVVSAAALEEDVVRGLDAGACDYIAKPYRTRELLARVRARLTALALVPSEGLSEPALAPASATSDAPTPLAGIAEAEPLAPTELPTESETISEAETPITDNAASELPPLPVATPLRTEQKMPEWVHTPVQRAGSEPRRTRPRQDEEPVFISDAEEMQLLREPVTQTTSPLEAPRAAIDEPPRTIGQRLRNERLRRHLTLVQIENETRVRISYLQAIEDDKFTLIPRGPASQQMVKAYAEYLGIDSAAVMDEFRRLYYVEANDPLPALGGTPTTRNIPRWLFVLIAIVLAIGITLGAIFYFDPQFFARVGEWLNGLWLWAQGFRA